MFSIKDDSLGSGLFFKVGSFGGLPKGGVENKALGGVWLAWVYQHNAEFGLAVGWIFDDPGGDGLGDGAGAPKALVWAATLIFAEGDEGLGGEGGKGFSEQMVEAVVALNA